MNFGEGSHPLTLLIPELHLGALQTVANSKGHRLLEGRFRRVAACQVVIGNTAIKVMDMMKADVAGEPLQDTRQTIVRTAFHRRTTKFPLLVRLPIGVFKLMLDEKQPAPNCSGNDHNRDMN